jgi:hypothetical protein
MSLWSEDLLLCRLLCMLHNQLPQHLLTQLQLQLLRTRLHLDSLQPKHFQDRPLLGRRISSSRSPYNAGWTEPSLAWASRRDQSPTARVLW